MMKENLIAQAERYLRLALPLMVKYDIPVTPRNYFVWYKYVTNGNEEMAKVIEGMIKAGKPFSEEAMETLYRRFCAEKGESELQEIKEALVEVLLTTHGLVSDFTGRSEEHERFISNSVNMLSEEASPQEIRGVISEIIDKTKILSQVGKEIRHKLKESTEALEVLGREFDQAKAEASLDFLTGVANRKMFENTLTALVNEATSKSQPLSLLMIDIDHFKKFNDDHGHLIGDEVLKFVANKIKRMVKGKDLLSRFGGEEFTLILSQTPLEGARVVAEDIRSFFSTAPLKAARTSKSLGNITVSIGIASYRAGESSEDLIHRSDRALYEAKKAGRNCCAESFAEGFRII
jgi:diguanylate cyclase